MRLRKPHLMRIALTVVWVFAVEAMTSAGGELVRITSPKDSQQVKGPIRVEAQTTVEDPAYLIFCVDGARPHSTNVRPYCYDLDTTGLPAGPHVLAAEVYAREGLIAQSSPVTILVGNVVGTPQPQALAQTAPAAPQAAIPAAAPKARASAAGSEGGEALAPVLVLRPAAAPAPAAQRDPMRPATAPAFALLPKLRVPERTTALAGVTVILDGRTLSFDVAPSVDEGRTFGALRTVIESSGGTVAWLHAAKQAVAKRTQAELRVAAGSSEATLDGRPIELGAAVVLRDGRIVVPLRTTCEPLGYTVAWTEDSRTVRLCSALPPVQVGALQAK